MPRVSSWSSLSFFVDAMTIFCAFVVAFIPEATYSILEMEPGKKQVKAGPHARYCYEGSILSAITEQLWHIVPRKSRSLNISIYVIESHMNRHFIQHYFHGKLFNILCKSANEVPCSWILGKLLPLNVKRSFNTVVS